MSFGRLVDLDVGENFRSARQDLLPGCTFLDFPAYRIEHLSQFTHHCMNVEYFFLLYMVQR